MLLAALVGAGFGQPFFLAAVHDRYTRYAALSSTWIFQPCRMPTAEAWLAAQHLTLRRGGCHDLVCTVGRTRRKLVVIAAIPSSEG